MGRIVGLNLPSECTILEWEWKLMKMGEGVSGVEYIFLLSCAKVKWIRYEREGASTLISALVTMAGPECSAIWTAKHIHLDFSDDRCWLLSYFMRNTCYFSIFWTEVHCIFLRFFTGQWDHCEWSFMRFTGLRLIFCEKISSEHPINNNKNKQRTYCLWFKVVNERALLHRFSYSCFSFTTIVEHYKVFSVERATTITPLIGFINYEKISQLWRCRNNCTEKYSSLHCRWWWTYPFRCSSARYQLFSSLHSLAWLPKNFWSLSRFPLQCSTFGSQCACPIILKLIN